MTTHNRAWLQSKQERAAKANKFLEVIAANGRKFFACNDRVSRFEVDERGRIWFIDACKQARIYTQHKWSKWRGFNQGGTLLVLIKQLRDYIRTGEPQWLNLGPWPDWCCDGDPWGYGESMEQVRTAAIKIGLTRTSPEKMQS